MKLSRSERSLLIGGSIIAALAIGAGAVLPRLAKASSCGGNSAALYACQSYIAIVQLWTSDHDQQTFRLDKADDQTKRWLGAPAASPWLRSARLLARLDNVRIDPAGEKRIIMVCDQAYDNVPQRLFGRAPKAHAVAYSTGETGLISPAEFARLDRRGFTDKALPLKKSIRNDAPMTMRRSGQRPPRMRAHLINPQPSVGG